MRILDTDRLATIFFDEAPAASWAQTVKGLLFVAVPAAGMTLAVVSYMRRANRDRHALEDAWDETILGWVLAMDARESTLATHSQRVADLTLQSTTRWRTEIARPPRPELQLDHRASRAERPG